MINLYRVLAGFNLSYDELKDLCTEAWKDADRFVISFRAKTRNEQK